MPTKFPKRVLTLLIGQANPLHFRYKFPYTNHVSGHVFDWLVWRKPCQGHQSKVTVVVKLCGTFGNMGSTRLNTNEQVCYTFICTLIHDSLLRVCRHGVVIQYELYSSY